MKLKTLSALVLGASLLASPLYAIPSIPVALQKTVQKEHQIWEGEIPQVDPLALMWAGYTGKSVILGYDTNKDKREDLRFVYSIDAFSEGVFTKLTQIFIDNNKDGIFEPDEIYEVPDN